MIETKRVSEINAVFLCTIVFNIAAGFLPQSLYPKTYAGQLLFSQILLAAPAICYIVFRRIPVGSLLRLRPVKIKTVFLTLLFTICISPVLTFLSAFSMTFAHNVIGDYITNITTELPLAGGILVVALIPAIFEESVYRGLFYESYSKINIFWGAVMSGMLFGLMHGNLNQFIYAFFMGVIFAILIEATDSIIPGMLMHFCINGYSVLITYLLPKLYEKAQQTAQDMISYGELQFVNFLESVFGDLSLTKEEWLKTYMDAEGQFTLSEVMTGYLPQALIFGVFAYLLIAAIAKYCNRSEALKNAFSRRERRMNKVTQSPMKVRTFITTAMAVGIAIGLFLLITNELIMIYFTEYL